MASKSKPNSSPAQAGPAPVKRGPKSPANAEGSSVDLSELGLLEKFAGGRSQYEREIDQLVADTKASDNPTSVGRKYTDMRAINSLKKRADKKGVRLQFLTLPGGQGFVVRVDPDPKTRVSRKPVQPVTAQTAEVNAVA